jgi:hypothetical protein
LKPVPNAKTTSTLVPAINSLSKSEYLFPAGVSVFCVSPSHYIMLSLEIDQLYPVTIFTEALPIVSFVTVEVSVTVADGLNVWLVAKATDLPFMKSIKFFPCVICLYIYKFIILIIYDYI